MNSNKKPMKLEGVKIVVSSARGHEENHENGNGGKQERVSLSRPRN